MTKSQAPKKKTAARNESDTKSVAKQPTKPETAQRLGHPVPQAAQTRQFARTGEEDDLLTLETGLTCRRLLVQLLDQWNRTRLPPRPSPTVGEALLRAAVFVLLTLYRGQMTMKAAQQALWAFLVAYPLRLVDVVDSNLDGTKNSHSKVVAIRRSCRIIVQQPLFYADSPQRREEIAESGCVESAPAGHWPSYFTTNEGESQPFKNLRRHMKLKKRDAFASLEAEDSLLGYLQWLFPEAAAHAAYHNAEYRRSLATEAQQQPQAQVQVPVQSVAPVRDSCSPSRSDSDVEEAPQLPCAAPAWGPGPEPAAPCLPPQIPLEIASFLDGLCH